MNNATTTDIIKEHLPDIPWLDMGAGFLIGMGVGFFLKKSFKLLLLFLGIGVALIFGLEQLHVVQVDETHLKETVEQGSGFFKQAFVFLKDRLSRFGAAGSGSAIAGFLVGLKMG